MGHLYIPGEKKIIGPWLLDLDNFEELNEIFEFVDSKLLDCIERDITKEAEEVASADSSRSFEQIKGVFEQKWRNKRTKRVTLTSYDEKILFDSTIAGLLKDPKLIGFKPREIQLLITDGRYRNEFKLSINRFDGELEYRVKCTHQDIEDDIKYRVENWLDKFQPSKPKQWWNKHSLLIAVYGLLICIISVTQIPHTEKIDIKDSYRNQINAVLDSGGVNETNRDESIELLLKYTIEYKSEEQATKSTINKIAVRVFLSSLFFVLISIFKPKTTIGIGANKNLVKFYKVYSNFVLVTIPAVFIVPPLIEWIQSIW